MIFAHRLAYRAIEKFRKKGVVALGPFAGSPAAEDSIQHCWMRLLGVYEFYLHPYIEDAILQRPPVVVDVGTSTGYYSIGLAYRLTKSKHIAFEMQSGERESLSRTASKIPTAINLKGLCTVDALREITMQFDRGLLVMDCEGGERELLCDMIHRQLGKWSVILEVHDWHSPGVGEEIQKRFVQSHHVQEIWSREPKAADFSGLLPWPLNYYCEKPLAKICAENRGENGMRFFYMTPKVSK